MNDSDVGVKEIVRLVRRDIRQMVKGISRDEARYLVDAYYQVQKVRTQSGNQSRAALEHLEACEMLQFIYTDMRTVEKNIHTALDEFSELFPIGRWAKSITGIGPVISAGLLAHIDLRKMKKPTAGCIWSFAGLNPDAVWGKGERRPWNASLRTLCWKIGESFVKVSSRPGDVYGKLWAERKGIETEKNEAGMYADQARKALTRVGKNTEAYKCYLAGKLPPGHIHARAKRWAVKLFLSHWHYVAHSLEFGCAPPKPYVIDHLGHVDEITVPNWPMEN